MGSYKIIGGDQKQYGPVSADDLRHWIAEGRLNAQTLILAEGSASWKPLAAFEEFTAALQAQAGQIPSTAAMAPPVSAEAWSAQILTQPATLQVGRCLSMSWRLMTDNFGLFFGSCFLIWLISFSELIPLIGLIYRVLAGVFYGGLYLIFLNRIRGKPASFGDAFACFRQGFAQLLLAGFLSLMLGALGFVFCILPGIYLMVAWAFSVPLVADKRLEFWSAMELSRKVVSRVWFEVFGLILLAFLPFIVASIVTQIIISISMFSSIREIMASGHPDFGRMMEMIMNVAKTSLPLTFLVKFIFLLNLPFALGALMYAYENLFGTRTAPAA